MLRLIKKNAKNMKLDLQMRCKFDKNIRLKKMNLCTACRNPDWTQHIIKFKNFFKLNNSKMSFYECNNCSVLYSNPQVLDVDVHLLYKNRNLIEMCSPSKIVKFLRKMRFNTYEKIIFDKSDQPLNILDYGCGDGNFALLLKKRNSKDTIVASDWFKVPPIKGSKITYLHNDQLPLAYSKKFDKIFLRHVLEHTVNPSKFIDEIKKLLSDEGEIIIEVPSSSNIWIKIFKSKYSQIVPEHMFIFNQKSLSKMFTKKFDVKFEKINIPVLSMSIFRFFNAKVSDLSVISLIFLVPQLIIDKLINNENAVICRLRNKVK